MVKNGTRTNGFTLVELMIVLAITGLLLVLATPSFTTTIQNNLLVTEVNELRTSLNLARSEAIKRNNNITICESSNGTACGDDANDWHNGWIVFLDNDNDGNVDNDDVILRVHSKLGEQSTNLIFSTTRITFASSGLASSGANSLFTLCDSRGADHAKGIIIGPTGRPRAVISSDAALECQ